ncbi:MAG: ribokinase [Bacillota bacterium]
MANILVVGSLNTDYVIDVERIVSPGETLLGRSSEKHFGGKGANQAVALARLGASVTMIGAVGTDEEGSALKNALYKEGIDTHGIQSVNALSGKAFIQRTRQDNAIVVAPGANMAFDLDLETIDFEAYDMIVLQNEIPFALTRRIIERAHLLDIKVLYNPAPAKKMNDHLLEKVNILVLNESEAKTITGIHADSEESVKAILGKLAHKVKDAVVLTRGSKGASYATYHTVRHEDAYKVTPVDTTGSGDSAVAGIAYTQSIGKTMRESVDFAQKLGALAATKKGAQSSLPTMKELLESKINK